MSAGSNPTTIKNVMVLLASNPNWQAKVINIEGAFLQGESALNASICHDP
jgi:hypothetical protein